MKSIVVIALLSIAGCKGKSEPPAVGSGSASAGSGSGSAKSGFGSGGAVESPQAGSAKGSGSASNELPKECDDWKAMVDKLMACDKMPEPQRKVMKDAYDSASALWPTTPATGKPLLATSCRAAADAIRSSAKATCGW